MLLIFTDILNISVKISNISVIGVLICEGFLTVKRKNLIFVYLYVKIIDNVNDNVNKDTNSIRNYSVASSIPLSARCFLFAVFSRFFMFLEGESHVNDN